MYLYMRTTEMHEMYHHSVSAMFLRVFLKWCMLAIKQNKIKPVFPLTMHNVTLWSAGTIQRYGCGHMRLSGHFTVFFYC